MSLEVHIDWQGQTHFVGRQGLLSHVIPRRRFSGSVQRQCIPHEADDTIQHFPRLRAAP